MKPENRNEMMPIQATSFFFLRDAVICFAYGGRWQVSAWRSQGTAWF